MLQLNLLLRNHVLYRLKNRLLSRGQNCQGTIFYRNLFCNVYNGICDDIEVKYILCWSDSQFSLAWIKDINSEFKTFVQNRLIVIRNNVHPDNWKYCSTNENPADIITKIKMCDISTNNLWWEGPHFLKNIVEYDNRSRKQTKTEIDDSLLNSLMKGLLKEIPIQSPVRKRKIFKILLI